MALGQVIADKLTQSDYDSRLSSFWYNLTDSLVSLFQHKIHLFE